LPTGTDTDAVKAATTKRRRRITSFWAPE
jgi:hypothetical protein